MRLTDKERELIKKLNPETEKPRGNKVSKYYFFYGGVLSQWAPTRFVDIEYYPKQVFVNCEQYMMAGKARLFKDRDTFRKIMLTGNPKDIKALGRSVQRYDEETWHQYREQIVLRGNILRAMQDPDFKRVLLANQHLQFVEASFSDRIWGIGFDAKRAPANVERWGSNLLGKALSLVPNYLNSNTVHPIDAFELPKETK